MVDPALECPLCARLRAATKAYAKIRVEIDGGATLGTLTPEQIEAAIKARTERDEALSALLRGHS